MSFSPLNVGLHCIAALLAVVSLAKAEPIKSAEEAVLSFKDFLASKESHRIPKDKLKEVLSLSEGARELKVTPVYLDEFNPNYDLIFATSADSRFTIFGSFKDVKKVKHAVWILDYYTGLGGAMRVYLDSDSKLPLQIHAIPTGE